MEKIVDYMDYLYDLNDEDFDWLMDRVSKLLSKYKYSVDVLEQAQKDLFEYMGERKPIMYGGEKYSIFDEDDWRDAL